MRRKKGPPLVLVVTGALLCIAQAGCGDPKLQSDWYGCSEDAGLGCPAGMVCLTVPDGGGEQRCYTEDPTSDASLPDADAGESCGPGSCLGCCDPGDECQAGDQDQLCGSDGAACEDCTSEPGGFCSGQTCQSGGCVDNDGDGYGLNCTLGTDHCDDDAHNWTDIGCTDCIDTDGDGYGAYCDLGADCDDDAPGITVGCQVNGCPEGWVHIQAGDFQMGCHTGELDGTCQSADDELPRHTVMLSAYCLEVTEVSVEAYRACKAAGVCTGTPTPTDTGSNKNFNWSASPGSREAHPINGIDWSESQQYCQLWLGGDLPTEAEWEKGARGASVTRKFPWGASPEPDCGLCNFDVNGGGTPGYGCNTTSPPSTWEVGHLTGTAGDSPYGLKDMAGNVWEWVRDWYQVDFYSSCISDCTDPMNTDSGSGNRSIRGGGFNYSAIDLRVVSRNYRDPTHRNNYVGFRCRRTP